MNLLKSVPLGCKGLQGQMMKLIFLECQLQSPFIYLHLMSILHKKYSSLAAGYNKLRAFVPGKSFQLV